MIKKSFYFFSRFFFVFFIFNLALFLPNIGNSFLPTISFWQMGRFPIATVDSTAMGATLTNSLAARSVQVGGLAILNYKALVINSGTCTDPGVAASLICGVFSQVGVFSQI